MPSLRTLDVVHRLNSPTRAAAARRRRLRKAIAIACLLLAAFVIIPRGSGAGRPTSRVTGATGGSLQGPPPDMRGRHALAVRSLTPVQASTSQVDVWDGSGTRLARCAPTLAGHSDGGSPITPATQDAIVTVALTDAEVAAVTRHLARDDGQPSRLVVSACL